MSLQFCIAWEMSSSYDYPSNEIFYCNKHIGEFLPTPTCFYLFLAVLLLLTLLLAIINVNWLLLTRMYSRQVCCTLWRRQTGQQITSFSENTMFIAMSNSALRWRTTNNISVLLSFMFLKCTLPESCFKFIIIDPQQLTYYY